MTPLLEAEGLRLRRRTPSGWRPVLDGVGLRVGRAEAVGLVGPSGSGKSTLARVLMRLERPEAGRLRLDGADLLAMPGAALRRLRRRWQMVFQDPLAALNPRATVFRAVADPLAIHATVPRREIAAEVGRLLGRVGLDPALAGRAVHEISGGQRQRVAIARAIAPRPDLLVLDEAVSALDVLVRAQILALLASLRAERGLALLFIGHDLAVVRAVSDRILVMDGGRIVEEGPAAEVIRRPRSETARALVAAVPRLPPLAAGAPG